MQLVLPKWLWAVIGGLVLLIVGIVAYLLYRLYKSDNAKSFNFGDYLLGDIALGKGMPTTPQQAAAAAAVAQRVPVAASNPLAAGGTQQYRLCDGATLTLLPGRGSSPEDIEWIRATDTVRNVNVPPETRADAKALLESLMRVTLATKGAPAIIS